MALRKKKSDTMDKLEKLITSSKMELSKLEPGEKPKEYRTALKKLKRAQRRLTVLKDTEKRASEPKKKKKEK